MASIEECEQAFRDLAAQLGSADGSARKKAAIDRTISCTLRDLGVVFSGRLTNGELLDIRRTSDGKAQVRMTMTSDDLLRLVGGELHLVSAWAGGRVKIDASVLDLVRLRSVF